MAVAKTDLAPLGPGEVANNSMGLLDHIGFSSLDIQSNTFLKAVE